MTRSFGITWGAGLTYPNLCEGRTEEPCRMEDKTHTYTHKQSVGTMVEVHTTYLHLLKWVCISCFCPYISFVVVANKWFFLSEKVISFNIHPILSMFFKIHSTITCSILIATLSIFTLKLTSIQHVILTKLYASNQTPECWDRLFWPSDHYS